MCHALAAIASHLPVLGDGMLGDLVDLYRVASHSSTDKQQELLVRNRMSQGISCSVTKKTLKNITILKFCFYVLNSIDLTYWAVILLYILSSKKPIWSHRCVFKHKYIWFGILTLPLWLLQVSLATVIFVASQSSLSAEVKSVIKQQLENVANGWTVYRIARQASRMVRSRDGT